MKAKYLTALLALSVLAVPAAVPASQPADIRVTALRQTTATVVAPKADLALLMRDTQDVEGIDFVLPTGVIAHDWVSADPFGH